MIDASGGRYAASLTWPEETWQESIGRLHRAPSSWVAVYKKEGDRQKPALFLKVEDIGKDEEKARRADRKIRELRETGDLYFSINGFRRGGTRKTEYLSQINAYYADIDYHDTVPMPTKMTEAEAVRECLLPAAAALSVALAAQEAHRIPPASYFIRSGRGLWLFWILSEPLYVAPGQWRGAKREYRRVQDAIQARLLPMFGEKNLDQASDLVRNTRVPGSLHTGANRRVRLGLQSDESGAMITYTADELSDAFGAPNPKRTASAIPTQASKTIEFDLPRHRVPSGKGPSVPSRANGPRSRWSGVLDDVLELEGVRGGFAQGHRTKAVAVISFAMARLNFPAEVASKEARRLAGACRPPLPDEETDATALSTWTYARANYLFRNASIIKRLGITPDEQRGLSILRGATVRAEDATRKRPAMTASRRDGVAAVVAARVEAGLPFPTAREVATALGRPTHGNALRTIYSDLARLAPAPPPLPLPNGVGVLARPPQGTRVLSARSVAFEEAQP